MNNAFANYQSLRDLFRGSFSIAKQEWYENETVIRRSVRSQKKEAMIEVLKFAEIKAKIHINFLFPGLASSQEIQDTPVDKGNLEEKEQNGSFLSSFPVFRFPTRTRKEF